jgi:hypothetical protein
MFRFDNRPTKISRMLAHIIEHSALNLAPGDPNSLACTVYKTDPLDQYPFITVHAGVRYVEPMYGGVSYGDESKVAGSILPDTFNPFGYRAREGIRWHETFREVPKINWRIHLSGRGSWDASNSTIAEFRKTTVPVIKDLIESMQDPLSPPFPELWYRERLARDDLRDRFRGINFTYNLWEVAHTLNSSIRKSLQDELGHNDTHIGIYLKTDQAWELFGSPLLLPRRPARVMSAPSDADPGTLNAFDWAGRALRPVLIRPDSNPEWIARLTRCGHELTLAYRENSPYAEFAGACIVPIADLHNPGVSIGLMTLISHGVERVAPAHLFLLNRLALGVAGYLEPYNPLPGYSKWPRTVPSRGNAKTEWSSPVIASGEAGELTSEIVERFASDLMPVDSTVTISQLQAGQGGAEVFQLGVRDKEGNSEVYRVLKVGRPHLIASELANYHRYVHNKTVGGASRLDVAKTINYRGQKWAGIVYIFVGAGEDAIPWSSWGIDATHDELNHGIQKLFEQLACWNYNIAPGNKSAIDLFIVHPFLDDVLAKDDSIIRMTSPTFKEVQEFIISLQNLQNRSLRRDTSTVVVHGDLHAGNIFALCDPDREGRQINNVAVIDWGSVRPASHPLSDIAKLMADLYYKIRWDHHHNDQHERQWMYEVFETWRKKLAPQRSADHWKLAFIHQVSKMLFYHSGAYAERRTYFSDEARAEAWRDLKTLAGEIKH